MSTLSGSNLFKSIEVADLTTVCQRLDNRSITGEERDSNGQTYLMAACIQGNFEVVKKLLENDVEVNSVDFDDWTALHYACKEGQFDCMVALLENGASLETRDVGGWTPLMWACYKGRTDMVRYLLDRGANVHVKGEHHISCVIWAAGRGYTDIVEILLEKGAKVNTTDKYGTSPMVWAARKGHLEIVRMLLSHGANVDVAGMYSWTPLIVAAKRGFVEVVRAILDHNPNINCVDKDGFTALTCAVKGGHVEVVEDLLENGAYVNLTDKDGDSILIQAVRAGNYEIVQILLHKYADVDVHGSEHKTALYHAVEKNYFDIAKAILSYSCDLELPSIDGDTPLMRAVRTRNVEMVDLLLHKGSKVHAKDKKGDTALHLALRGRSRKVTELLLRNPKNSRLLYQPNKNGETPYTIDGNHQKSILTQIYGARNLNASEANENLLGYELYSSTIADVLSEPTLCTPITVGLYAKWGSGKSFLLDKLKTEMQLFEHQTVDRTLQYTPLLFTCCTLISLLLGLTLGLLAGWPGGLGLGCGLLLLLLAFIGLIWFGTNIRDWESAYKISVYLGTKFDNLKLLLQVIFCNPQEVSKDRSLVRYLFTGNTKLTTFSGEQSIAMMVATLADEMEKEIGVVTARLFKVFKQQKNSNNRRYRSICCIPNFIFVIFVLLCIIACIVLIALFPVAQISSSAPGSYVSTKDKDDDDDDDDEDQVTTNRSVHSFSPIYGTMIALGIVIGFALVGNVYTWWQMISALARPQRKRVMEAMKNMKASQVEKFIQTLKEEVLIMSDMVRSLNGFTNNQYRFVLFVDGLDSSEQGKLLQVLDLVNILFSEIDSPFVIILAVDPHIIIKGIEQNLPSLFRDSNINGHDYLRNVVHFPVFLQNQGLPIQRLLRRQQSRQNCIETNNIHRDSPPKEVVLNVGRRSRLMRQSSVRSYIFPEVMSRTNLQRQESVWSSTSLDKVARSKKKKERGCSLTASTSNYFASATDLSKTLVKNDYFSDMNPRSMRRLMNIVAITARLLRAYSIDYSWHRLATWVNITEQWPYRTSWIIWYFEDNEDLDESISLKEIYDKVVPSIPLVREVEPLLDIDRNVKKFEVFLSNNNPTLSVGDIKKFLPCCINIDPYLRKRIREYMKAYEQLPQDFPMNQVFGRGGVNGSSNNLGQLDGRLPSSGFQPIIRPNLQNITPSFYSQYHHQNHPSIMTPVTPMMRMPYVVPTHQPPSFSGPPGSACVIGGTKVYLKGGVPKKHLSSMLLDDVCELLMKLEGLGTEAIKKYQDEIFNNNINGFVLYNCDLDELKPVLGMNFGDWQLFKAMILALRSREEETLSGVPSSDRYMNQYLAISSENLHMECYGSQSEDRPRKKIDFYENTTVGALPEPDPFPKETIPPQCVENFAKLDSSGVTVVNKKEFENKKVRLLRKNSIAQQIQMESMILNDVIDEFSEGSSDENDASSDEVESPIYFAAEDNDLDSRLTTPEVTSPETREPVFPETLPADESQVSNIFAHRSSMKKPESSHNVSSPFGAISKVQFNIPENRESLELDSMTNDFYDTKLSELSSEHVIHAAEKMQLMMKQNDDQTQMDASDDENISEMSSLISKVKPTKEKSPDSADGVGSVNVLSLGTKAQRDIEIKKSQSDNRPKFFLESLHSAGTDKGTKVDVQVHQTLANAAAYSAGYKQGVSSATGTGKPSAASSKANSQASSRNPSTTASSESIKMAPDEPKKSSARSSTQSSRDSSPSSVHSGRHTRFSVTEVKIDMPIGSDSIKDSKL